MKILIFPTDDRLGQSSVISHYSKLGHEIYIPKRGTLGLNWNFISTWPSLLCKNSSNQLNFYTEIPSGEGFGEDLFLQIQGLPSSNLAEIPQVNFINEEEFNQIEFDAFHTLRGAENYLNYYFSLLKNKTKIKWISSTLNHSDHNPGNKNPKNIARILPASYERYNPNCNIVNLFCDDVEYDLFGLRNFTIPRTKKFASFNHNFAVRQVDEYRFFQKMNEHLSLKGIEEVVNYGGNIRKMGADIRFANNGPTGNFPTLSPIDNIKKYNELSGVVHFKQLDWGGGVFFHAMHSSTPIITSKNYVKITNSEKYIIHGFNSIVVETPQQAADAVEALMKDEVFDLLSSGMKQLKFSIFNENYWESWKNFLLNLR
jgi:hypothetical protein